MKKILFVILPYGPDRELQARHKLRSYVAMPYGVLSIASYLKRTTDADSMILDLNVRDNFKDTLEKFKPDIVAISMMFDISYRHIKGLARAVKEWNQNCFVVLGGAAATASYGTIIEEQPDIDAVCFGEGELPFQHLYYQGKIALDIDPSWVTRDKTIIPKRSKIENLDEVIHIDYSFINPDDYPMMEAFSPFSDKVSGKKQFFIVSSRGCPFNCNFCVNSANPDKTMRYASVDAVIDHVRHLVAEYGMNVLTFYDDQILLNKKRAKELFRRLAEFNLRIECPNGVSVAFIDDELAGLMRKAGMDTVNLAIESGSPHVLNNLIHKPLKIEQVQPVVDILRKYGFWIQGYFVLGIPGETDEHRKETVDAIKRWGLDWACISNACPTRGSRLYKECVEKGYIPKTMKIDDLDMNKFIITTSQCSPEHLVKESYLINLDVNFVNNHRYIVGDYETAFRAFLDVIKRYPDHAIAYYMLMNCAAKLFFQKTEGNKEWEEYAEEFELI